jgi:hypothetical protein
MVVGRWCREQEDSSEVPGGGHGTHLRWPAVEVHLAVRTVVALELSGGWAAWNLHGKATVGALAQGGRAKFAGKRAEGVAHWRHCRAE